MLIFSETYAERGSAMIRERQIKKGELTRSRRELWYFLDFLDFLGSSREFVNS